MRCLPNHFRPVVHFSLSELLLTSSYCLLFFFIQSTLESTRSLSVPCRSWALRGTPLRSVVFFAQVLMNILFPLFRARLRLLLVRRKT